MGSEARPAVPALVRAWRKAEPEGQRPLADALKKIDPEAAAAEGIL
jgi:hypothetical protein